MKTATLLVVAAAAVANAGYTENDGKYACGKPNTNYCLGGDIILRCDEYGHGTTGRCSNNLSGYPPAGAVGSCYEKPGSYGSAACEKNCVVYADTPYTLPAELCQPAYTVTSSYPEGTPSSLDSTPSYPDSTPSSLESITTVYTQPAPETTKSVQYNSTVPGEPGNTGKPTEPDHYTTKCVTFTYPNPTSPGDSVTRTITYTAPVYPSHNSTATYNPHNPPHTTLTTYVPAPSGGSPLPHHNGTCSTCHGGSGDYGAAGNGGQNGGESATRVPVGPASTSTSVPETIPTGAAAANAVSGLLAVAGIAAAFLI
ncbi:hypothetical protein G7Z17_g12208 [Cylindrodendrum hubeiense]|uniref:Uncharacterized protein n=1 Tax=Cylindrodendrum hubeiense TaxID=595255 RepID=A0A9P5GVU7_9HYPO|nr:hypothetical protein G7Z17_g12208 [Cylindrodendrum hubeiense]